jgi:hypothetical protein
MLAAVGTFAGVGFYAFSRGIGRQKIPVPALAECADLNLSAFWDRKMLTAVGTFAAVGFYAFSRGIEGRRFRSQPWQEVRTKTCPLFGYSRSGMMATGALAAGRTSVVPFSKARKERTEFAEQLAAGRTSVVPFSTKRHGVCQ